MKRNDALVRSLALVGTTLVALPLLAPVVLGLASIGRLGGLRIDYLMPFEVYPVTLVGVLLMVAASLWAKSRRAATGITVGVMFGGILLAGLAAELTGIADSVETLETWRYVLTGGLAALSLLAQCVLVALGILMVRDTRHHGHQATPPAAPATGS